MLRIALCDDDAVFLHNIHDQLLSWFRENEASEAVSIEEFRESGYLAGYVRENRFDIFLLDVEMPGTNGFELAEAVKRLIPTAIVIFLTSHSELSTEGYKVEAFRYITKPALKQQLPEAIRAAVDKLHRLDQSCLTLSIYQNIFRIPYHEIVYVRHQQQSTHIVTESQSYKARRGIRQIFEELRDPRFVFSDRGTFINLDHLRQIKGIELLMDNGDRLFASRRMLPGLKEELNCFLGG